MAHLIGSIALLSATDWRARTSRCSRLLAFALTSILGAACSEAEPEDHPTKVQTGTSKVGSTEFVSAVDPQDLAAGQRGEPVSADDAASPASTATAAGSSAPPAPGADAERAITEADIVHVDGDTLYALSEFSGLTLVDISEPQTLRVLGHQATQGTPFEMYVRDDVVISMVNAHGEYVEDEASLQVRWVESSRVLALDAQDPSNLKQIGEFSVPGSIGDSRLVGNILYLVTSEYGCWGCSTGPSTVISSFDLEDLSDVRLIDQLRFEEPPETYIGQRSISVTNERIYIGGSDWDWSDGNAGSVIQVVDITDAGGDLVAGAALPIAGQISSRWQMDEHAGTLRVLSQTNQWSDTAPPTLQTYKVHSASDISKLADLVVQLPRPEALQSVRFDADRAYAITFERTDPLITFDLSDPAAPRQVGELEIPGWVYHMEPRGDRVYGIGFDQGNAEGALHVSLFDVSDLAQPKMLQRVNFGGDWGSFAEDQDRIHKSFRLLDEQGFMVVPFSGWDWDEVRCNSRYLSGVQLVDFTTDTLTRRGIAPQVGEARRAFVHRDHLFGVGDDTVQSFDISDRDDIKKVDTVETARNIEAVRVVGDKVLRFGTDWWTGRTILDVTSNNDVETAETKHSLDLTTLVEGSNECSDGAYWGNVYVVGEYAYVERYAYSYENNVSSERLTFLVIDLNAATPTVVDTVSVGAITSQPYVYQYYSGVVQADSALLVGVTKYDYTTDKTTITASYQTVDVRSPEAPKLAGELAVPEGMVDRGWGRFFGFCGLDMGWGWGGYYGYGYNGYQNSTVLVSGDIIASSHVEALPDDPTRGRYYLDRLDVSDPEKPVFLDTVNIPGRVAHFEADTGRLLTIERIAERVNLTREECWARSSAEPTVTWVYTDDYAQGYCEDGRQTLHLLTLTDEGAELVQSTRLDGDGWYLRETAITSERVFVKQFQLEQVTDATGYTYWQTARERLNVRDQSLDSIATIDRGANAVWGWQPLRARGTRAFSADTGKLDVFDATDPEAVGFYSKQLRGYGCNELEVRGDVALCSQGKKGVERISLE
jgi:uncharacterized secreted protein with C-terminal beta-propeller domain